MPEPGFLRESFIDKERGMELQNLETRIKDLFGKINHPEHGIDLMELGMFGSLEAADPDVRLIVRTPDESKQLHFDIEAAIRKSLVDPGIPGKLIIKFEYDESLKARIPVNEKPKIANYIAVGSGKGGVGKSTVSANLASAMALQGYKVGIVDLDIYGPSLGKMFGMPGRVPLQMKNEKTIIPAVVHGIKVMSFSFLLNPDQAVVWRGPLLGSAVQQLLFDVDWGELDYLILDLPPGTGDVQLSLSQQLSVDGAVIVTTPQTVASLDAARAISMFEQVKIPVVGLVENMTHFICPHCGEPTKIFEGEGAKELTDKFGTPVIGSIPMQPEIMAAAEAGTPYVIQDPEGPVATAYREIVEKLKVEVEKYRA